MREGEHDEQNQERAQGEQHEVPQAAVLDGALRALFEEHQRTEGQRRALVFLQQVQPDGQSDGRDACEKPRGQKSHLELSPPDGEIFTQAFIEGA